MLRPRVVLSCLAIVASVALCGSAVALAASAGDQQYTDPFGSTTKKPPRPAATHASSTPSSSSSSSGSQASGSLSATSSAGSTTTASATATAGTSSSSLPRTGFDVYPLVIVGLVLLAGGLSIRRVLRSA